MKHKSKIFEKLTEDAYQPKTGVPCSCKPGVMRDNCPSCEGTGMSVDFAAIRNRYIKSVEPPEVEGPHGAGAAYMANRADQVRRQGNL